MSASLAAELDQHNNNALQFIIHQDSHTGKAVTLHYYCKKCRLYKPANKHKLGGDHTQVYCVQTQ
jgi:hypothetical protein